MEAWLVHGRSRFILMKTCTERLLGMTSIISMEKQTPMMDLIMVFSSHLMMRCLITKKIIEESKRIIRRLMISINCNNL
jgi:hypothetical protein